MEIAGRRVSANFVNGLPSAGRLDLLLEKRTGSTFVFRLVAEDPKATARERLLDLTPFARSDTGRIPFGRAPTDGLVGVYAYSSLLFRLSGGVEKKTGLSKVLNALAAQGIKIESLLFFSFLFPVEYRLPNETRSTTRSYGAPHLAQHVSGAPANMQGVIKSGGNVA